jgi:hypothetical protein
MTTTTKKWYVGLEDQEVLSIMSGLAHEVVAFFAQNEDEESEKLWDKFNDMFDTIIPHIVEEKTWYYMGNQEQYERFEKLKNDLWSIKHGIDEGMMSVLKFRRVG